MITCLIIVGVLWFLGSAKEFLELSAVAHDWTIGECWFRVLLWPVIALVMFSLVMMDAIGFKP